MDELTVSLKYETKTAPSGMAAQDVALPFRVMDADGGVVKEGAVSSKFPALLNVSKASAPLFVRLTWPSGKTETKRADGPSVIFDDSSISRNEWAAWAVPRLNKRTSLAVEASISEDTAINSYERVWLRLWKFRDGGWSNAPLAPLASNRNHAAVQLDFNLDQTGWCLQLGGTWVPWMMISLPPGGRCRVLITPNESTEPRKEPLKIVVTGFRSDTETLLEFLSRGSLRSAHAMASYGPLATKLMEKKFDDPVAAAAGAYYLLRTGEWRRIPLWWFKNLDVKFPWIADGAIIRCAVLTRSGLANSDAMKLAMERLGESLKRGVPIFSEGFSLLQEAASMLRPESRSTHAGVFEKIDLLVASRLWAGASFAFSGDDPSAPSPERRRGSPPKVRRPRGKEALATAGGAANSSMMWLQDIA